MSRRSKVVLVALIILILIVIVSLLNNEPSTEDKLGEWEEEIIDPNNELDPLNEMEDNTVFIIKVSQKVEGFIEKIFSFVIGLVERII